MGEPTYIYTCPPGTCKVMAGAGVKCTCITVPLAEYEALAKRLAVVEKELDRTYAKLRPCVGQEYEDLSDLAAQVAQTAMTEAANCTTLDERLAKVENELHLRVGAHKATIEHHEETIAKLAKAEAVCRRLAVAPDLLDGEMAVVFAAWRETHG